MKGSPEVIATLQKAASMELAIEVQYHLDKRDLRYQSLKKLASKFATFGEDSECYLKEITDRIFFLGADPEYLPAGATTRTSVTEILQRSLDAETAIVTAYNEWAILAAEFKDDNTRNKFEHWIKWHEDEHIDWLERQLAQISEISELEYVKLQLELNC
jgi:bacterioferritin